ncbi:MAG: transglutaminase domain-containing protein [Eubacterium sp.]|nr:transglutaminase domain-containing protein [Eubacterium sp.]
MKENNVMKVLKRVVAVVAMAACIIASPSVAYAAESAANLTELAKIVSEHGVARDTSKFSVTYTGNEADIDRLFDEDLTFFMTDIVTLWDDPNTSDDADYLAGNLNFTTDGHEVYTEGDKIFFKLKYFETLSQTNQVNEKVPGILSELGVDSMTNYEKVKAIHDYVCDLITYDADGGDVVSTMYGAVFNRRALCNSYSLCMYKLLTEAGVPCKFIGGVAGTGRDSGGHAWNIVALGDKWYNLDATWDDSDEGISYDYFLKGSSDFDEADPEQKHTMDAPFKKAPFSTTFPIAKTAFNPNVMSDENTNVTTADTGSDEDVSKVYKLSDIVEGKYPSSGKFTVKKNKGKDLQLFIKSGKESLVSKATYKVTKGKSYIKSIKNYGLCEDEGGYFTDLYFKGKKKGTVNIKITLKLTNGQSLSYTFKGKVK